MLSEHLDSFLDPMINTATPIALGERLYSRWDFKSILASGAVDIIQPDRLACRGHHRNPQDRHNGGGVRRRAWRCIVPSARLRLPPACRSTAARYNAVIQEQSLGIHYNVGNDLLDYLTDPSVFDYAEGFVAIPTGPGLGIDVNEDYVIERAEHGHRWRNPIWRHADGSIAEW